MRLMRLAASCTAIALAAVASLGRAAAQDDTIKIGLVIPLTGPSAAVGREISDAAKLFIAQHGDTVAGRKIALIVRDDAGVADNAKRIAADLIANDKVSILAAGLTPSALAIAPAATKIVTLVMAPGPPKVLASSPYFVSTAVAAGRESSIAADWAIKTGARKAVVIVSDTVPAATSGEAFAAQFAKGGEQGGGQILDTLKVPPANPDFTPAVQRTRDLHPDVVFVDVATAQTVALARQFGGLDLAGVKLIGPGSLIDDDELASTGDALLGLVTAGVYSAAHPSQLNKDYAAAYKKAAGHRANFTSVAAYDAMALIYAALQKTGGNADGDALLGAIKGLQWKSPRGPVAIDPATRDLVQTVYIRRIVRVQSEPWAIEIKPFPAAMQPRNEAAAN